MAPLPDTICPPVGNCWVLTVCAMATLATAVNNKAPAERLPRDLAFSATATQVLASSFQMSR